MSERQFELFYWRICLVLIAVSPWHLYYLKKSDLVFTYDSIIFMGVVLFASLPIQLLMIFIASQIFPQQDRKKFWVIEPSAQSLNKIFDRDLASCKDQIIARLAELGFKTEPEQGNPHFASIQFSKSQSKQVHTFIEHQFSGFIHLSTQHDEVLVDIKIIMHDTLLLETGEFSKLLSIGNYLILKSDQIKYDDFSFSLFCGTTLSMMTMVIVLIDGFLLPINYAWLFASATGAIGMILLTLAALVGKDKQKHVSYRLVLAGLYFAAIPYISLI